ncbi:MAG: DUF1302 domain-containing protein [Oceanococcus sp.]
MKTLPMTTAACLILAASPFAHAIDFELGPINGRIDNAVTAGAAWRLEKQNPDIIGRANTTADGVAGRAYSTNGDDGNLAFDKGDLISGGIKLNSTMYLNWGNFGAQVRGSYLYDFVLVDQDFFDEEDYAGAPGRLAGPEDLQRRRSQLQGRLGNDADLLDGFIFGSFDVANRILSFRVGHQVLNWGESTLVLNGLNSIVAADASQLRVPGVDLSEVFIPMGMAWASIDLTDNVSIEGFYQYDWRATEPDPSGSFFATNDFATFGGETAEVGFGRCPELSAPGACAAAALGSAIPRKADRKPDDGGQGGGALRWFTPLLGGVDLGLYAANYHSRLPVISGTAAPLGFEGAAPQGGYFVEYPEDIKIYGLSFNTTLPFAGLSLQGEYSFKQDQPLQIEDVEILLAGLRTPLPSQIGPFLPNEEIQGWRRHDVSQWDVSTVKILGPSKWLGYDQALFLLEIAGSHIHSLPDNDELLYEGPATYLPADPIVAGALGVVDGNGRPLTQQSGYATAYSWGYRMAARFTYNNVMNRFVISPTLVLSHDVNGTSATPVLNFVQGRKTLLAGISASYLQVWELGLGYQRYWGGGSFNLVQDRDNVSLSLGYSF